MSVINWIKSSLAFLSLHRKTKKLLFLGLDCSGKSSLLHMLIHGKMTHLFLNYYPESQEFSIGNFQFLAFDLAGHETARKNWKNYLGQVDGIVFMVDAADRENFEIARYELYQLLASEELKNTAILVFGNKIDIMWAVSERDLCCALGLENFVTGSKGKIGEGVRPVGLFMCSVARGVGYLEGFEWMIRMLW